MHNLIAFYESITNGSTYAEVSGVADQSMSLDSSSRFIMPGPWKVFGAYAMGINLSAARVNAPSLREIALPEIYPANDTADVPTIDQIVNWYGHGQTLRTAEPVIVEVSRAGADAQPCIAGLWIGPRPVPAQPGPAITLVATTSNTLVAGSWTLSTLAFNQSLPAGTYEVIGMAVLCNDATFARLVFPGVGQYRPGVLVNDAYGDLTLNDPFRFGRFGSFGVFTNVAIPSIEILGDTGGAESAVVYLDVVKRSNQVPGMQPLV